MTATFSCVDQGLVHRAQAIVQTLRQAHLSVVTAESCTAGIICSALSQADGAREVLHGSFVTYCKANKTMALGVDRALLKRDGSVACDVVREMVQGDLLRSLPMSRSRSRVSLDSRRMKTAVRLALSISV